MVLMNGIFDFDFLVFYLVRSKNTYFAKVQFIFGNSTITLVLTKVNMSSQAKKDRTRNRYCLSEVLSHILFSKLFYLK